METHYILTQETTSDNKEWFAIYEGTNRLCLCDSIGDAMQIHRDLESMYLYKRFQSLA